MALQYRFKLTVPKIPLLTPAESTRIQHEEYGRGVFTLLEHMATHAREHVRVDRGILRGSIYTRVDLGSGPLFIKGLFGTGNQAPHAVYVERGTRPHWAPIAPLKAWARRVLRNEQAAYAIQRVIASRGTRPYPFMQPAYDAVRPQVLPVMTAARDRVAQRLGTP